MNELEHKIATITNSKAKSEPLPSAPTETPLKKSDSKTDLDNIKKDQNTKSYYALLEIIMKVIPRMHLKGIQDQKAILNGIANKMTKYINSSYSANYFKVGVAYHADKISFTVTLTNECEKDSRLAALYQDLCPVLKI